MKQTGGFILICLVITFGYFIGVLRFLTDYGEDMCEMTYMFEYPQYVKISNKADKQFKKYGLYAYSEGRITEKTRNMYFDGIPILFIPGNKGSHKQVRSLSSVALRKWLNSRLPFHFDYFTVDLNDEYSGLYGPLLYDQQQYVNASLFRILELYQNQKNPPRSVVLIGHSMGGAIALKLLSEMSDHTLVPILITLASPLRRAPIMMDYHAEKFFSEILNKNLDTTTVISIGGGYRDIVIPPFLIGNKEKDISNIVTSNIPMSWTESNHVQVLWCKQVVMALNRALFDSVDINTRQISSNFTHRNMAFKHNLIHHSGTKVRNRENYFKPVQLNQKGQWIENLRKQYSVERPTGSNQIHWYMVSITDVAGYEKLSVLAVSMDIVDWVFACNAYIIKGSSRICREALHMTHKSEIAPSAKYKRRFFNINLKDLKKEHPDLTHIVFRSLPTDDPLEYHVDIHGADQRSLTIQLPSWFSFKSQVILEKTPERALKYEIIIAQLNHIIQYYKLFLEPLECSKSEHHASITLTVPWSSENYHGFVTNNVKKPFNVRLFSSKPSALQNSSAVIKLILDPSCTYRISIRSSIFGTLGQIARTYSPLLLANIAAVALMSLRYQFKSLEEGYCSIPFAAIQEGAKPYYVLTAYKIMSRLLSWSILPRFFLKPDYLYMLDDGTDFFLLPLLLYLCSVGILWMLTVAFSISLVALESTIHKLSLKLLAATVSFNMAWSDYFLSYLQKLPVVVALTLICLSMGACGGLALCLGAGFYFLKLTQMSQDFVEEVVWFFVKQLGRKCKAFFKKRSSNNPDAQVIVASTSRANFETSRHTHGQIETNSDNSQQDEPTENVLELRSSDNTIEDSENEENSLEMVDKEVMTEKINKSGRIIRRSDLSPVKSRKNVNKEMEGDGDKVNEKEFEIIGDDKHADENLEQNQWEGAEENDREDGEKIKNTGELKVINATDCDDTNSKTEDDREEKHGKNALEENTETATQQLVKKCKKIIPNRTRRGFRSNSDNKKPEDLSFEDLDLSSSYNAIFFHSTIFFLWCIVTIINIPAVLTWAHNFRYTTALIPDDSFIPGFALSVCALVLWQFDFPKTNRKWMNEMETFIMIMAVLSLVFATISIYRLNYLLTLTIIVVTFYQLLAPKVDGPGTDEDDKFDKSKASEKPDYSDLKTKME